MNLLEKIAFDCGVKAGTPYIDQLFLPLKNHNFIIIDTRSKNPLGSYDYFTDVFEMIKKYLKQANIDVFQFASDDSYKLPCDKCFITINKKQEAYLVSKAKLIVTNENYSQYFASILNTKSISLYSINNSRNTRPLWNLDSQVILESDRDGNLPTYGQLNESPKTVNFISPYIIAEKILNSLNIFNDFNKFQLVHLGRSFNQKIIEVVPNFISNPEFLKNANINLRLDYVDDLDLKTLIYWLDNKKVNLLTNKDINLKSIFEFKKNIMMLTIILTDKISETFLKQAKQMGFRMKLFCKSDEELSFYRNKFFDWTIEKDQKNFNKLTDLKNISNKSFFVSSKILISKGKQFSCKANYLINKFLDKSQETVIFSPEFEEELEHFKIYNEREESSSSSSIS